ncbi:MAG: TrkA family potassium uptake protein [Actinobacteria bacterium]|nr:TrkA family potassium uptake protein [Actinomycetota bacterium]
MQILIVGGGIVGSFIARVLSEKHEVTVIEKDPEKYDSLRNTLPGVTPICEDGCEPWVLELAKIRDVDLVLAGTGDDEDNLVVSYLSKFEYDVPKVIARVNNPVNRWLFTKSWGVDVEVSTPDIIATVIEEEVSLGEVITVLKLQSGDIGLVEITLSPDAKALGESLAGLELPPETLIVTVVRDDAMLIPTADTVLQPGDRVLAITNFHNKEALEKLLGHGS